MNELIVLILFGILVFGLGIFSTYILLKEFTVLRIKSKLMLMIISAVFLVLGICLFSKAYEIMF